MSHLKGISTFEVYTNQTAPEPGPPFDFSILEARLLLTRFLRRDAPEFAVPPPSTHTSHEFFLLGA
jgi:hypothetical protein